ncbi:MAG TPA: hypothetical protein VM142_05675 [Acidimicrobiales bacterium]|nr:hypothetical protein [Acidimicrobiales bacterium]
MSDLDPDVIVLTDETFSERDTVPDPTATPGTRAGEAQPPGATAVFQGMLSALAEELQRLHHGTAMLHEAVASSRGETVAALAEMERTMSARMAALESGVARQLVELTTKLPGPREVEYPAQPDFSARTVVENLSPVIEDVNDRVSRVEEVLSRLVDQADLRSTTLSSELHGVMAGGMERLASLAARTDEATAAEIQGVRSRVEVIASSLAGLSAEVTGIAEVTRRLVDEGRARPLLDAIDASSREQGEVLSALHTSITRRIDARMRAVAEMVEQLSSPLDAAAALAPGLEEVGRAIAGQQAALERMESIAAEVATTVGGVQGGLAAALARQETALEQVLISVADRRDGEATVREAVAGLEASMAASLEAVRSYLGEGLMHVSRRQAGAGKAMESAAAALQSMERQLNGLAGLCQSLASGAEQQTGASARVADLVLETRSALRSDVDRLEATVHLESLKLHQQDQARLAGAASATTEVVEREAALLAQRVSAVAAAVESVRSVLHTHVEDASRGVAAPLSLVKDKAN